MSDPYIGEIRMFGGNFAPAGWAHCNGAPMPISENDALFILLGTYYGGDGETTFNLPDLQGRLPVHAGQGPGISQNYMLSEQGGVEQVTATVQQIPVHNHVQALQDGPGTFSSPKDRTLAPSALRQFTSEASNGTMNTGILATAGGDQPHENMMPYLAITFIISLFGIFPQQT